MKVEPRFIFLLLEKDNRQIIMVKTDSHIKLIMFLFF